MIFNSIVFLFLFLPISLFFYYLTPVKHKYKVLLVLSLIFFSWGNPKYLILILFSMTINYLVAMIMDARRSNLANRKSIMVALVTFNILILFVFKYLGFLIFNINFLFKSNLYVDKLVQPLGISFYTFQVLSYVFDVYRGKIKVERNPMKLFLYFIMFPQLASGPIMRYGEIEPQIKPRLLKFDFLADGMERFIVGLFKKVIIANTLGALWTTIKGLPNYEISTLTAWIGIFAFTLYIYFDFSGYMDMAIGVASLFGYRLKENFNFPYISKSVSEFWRRWHISLGSWFKDYIYIPMGGSRSGNLIVNTMTVWLVTGLWHGASWNFIVWGLYFGVIILIEKYLLKNILEKIPGFLANIYTMFLVIIGWVFFDTATLGDAVNYLSKLFGVGTTLIDQRGIYYLYTYLVIFILAILLLLPWVYYLVNKVKQNLTRVTKIIFVISLIFIFILSISYILNTSFSPSMYIGF